MRTRSAPNRPRVVIFAAALFTGCQHDRPSVCEAFFQHESFFATAVDEFGDTVLGTSITFNVDGAAVSEALCAWRVATGDCVQWISGSEATGHYLVTASAPGFMNTDIEVDVRADANGDTETVEFDFQMVAQ